MSKLDCRRGLEEQWGDQEEDAPPLFVSHERAHALTVCLRVTVVTGVGIGHVYFTISGFCFERFQKIRYEYSLMCPLG